ncbi:hypothetical protein JMUB7526_28660 [Staphylococcus aureus]
MISWFADGRLKMHENAAWLDGQRLPPQGYAADDRMSEDLGGCRTS